MYATPHPIACIDDARIGERIAEEVKNAPPTSPYAIVNAKNAAFAKQFVQHAHGENKNKDEAPSSSDPIYQNIAKSTESSSAATKNNSSSSSSSSRENGPPRRLNRNRDSQTAVAPSSSTTTHDRSTHPPRSQFPVWFVNDLILTLVHNE